MKDKFNALRLVNLVENEISKLEDAVKTRNTAKIRELKGSVLTFYKELQREIET